MRFLCDYDQAAVCCIFPKMLCLGGSGKVLSGVAFLTHQRGQICTLCCRFNTSNHICHTVRILHIVAGRSWFIPFFNWLGLTSAGRVLSFWTFHRQKLSLNIFLFPVDPQWLIGSQRKLLWGSVHPPAQSQSQPNHCRATSLWDAGVPVAGLHDPLCSLNQLWETYSVDAEIRSSVR